MSRTALVGTFVVIIAGLSGCASPAKIVQHNHDAKSIVIAVPDDTNTWPYYYKDEAIKTASAYLTEPELKSVKRVKVGEQMTNMQDSTRRDIGGGNNLPRVGEVTTSTNTTSVSDKYEYHMEFVAAVTQPPDWLRGHHQQPPKPTGPPLEVPKPLTNSVSPASGVLLGNAAAENLVLPSMNVTPPSPPATDLPPVAIPGPSTRRPGY